MKGTNDGKRKSRHAERGEKQNPPTADIKPDAPFDDDALGRKDLARFLTQRVVSSVTPYTLALDANWGEGKTIFLKMWQAELKKSGFQCVYYDAWASDFCRDSFPSMVAELKESFSGSKSKTMAEKIAKKGSAVVKAMAKNLPGSLAGLVGGGEVAQAAVNEIFGEWEPVAAYSEYRKALEAFKSSLGEIASQSGKPLIFMIDELDRCRPTFALDVLEKIKHIFDVQGVFFVAALNKNALAKTIESVYGITDGNDYLSKFFDDTQPLTNDRGIAPYLVEKAGVFDVIMRDCGMKYRDAEAFVSTLSELFRSHSVSLRGQKQIVESIAGCLKKFALGQKTNFAPKINWDFLFYFVFLHCRNPSLFAKTLATTKNARSDSDLLSLVPARELMAFVYGEKSFFPDNSTLEQECKIVSKLTDSDNINWLTDIYVALIYFRCQCDSDFRNELDEVNSGLYQLSPRRVDARKIYNLMEKISHMCDDES